MDHKYLFIHHFTPQLAGERLSRHVALQPLMACQALPIRHLAESPVRSGTAKFLPHWRSALTGAIVPLAAVIAGLADQDRPEAALRTR